MIDSLFALQGGSPATRAYLTARSIVGAPITERETALVSALEDALLAAFEARTDKDAAEESLEDAEQDRSRAEKARDEAITEREIALGEIDHLKDLLDEVRNERDTLRERKKKGSR